MTRYMTSPDQPGHKLLSSTQRLLGDAEERLLDRLGQCRVACDINDYGDAGAALAVACSRSA